MERRITVKGIGNVKVKPDLIVLTMELESHAKVYEQTMELAAETMERLLSAIELAGFNRKDLKTTHFDVQTHYESYRDENKNYKRRFNGYICAQHVKLEFDLDFKKLSEVLKIVTQSAVHPELNIQFSVKDKTAVNKKLLVEATKNAKEKAEILSSASNVKLERLLLIDYNWSDLYLYSPTHYNTRQSAMIMEEASAPEIEPEEISASDTVTFVWEII